MSVPNMPRRSQSIQADVKTTPPLLRTLFSPLRVNGLMLPNRVFMNGLHLGFEKLADPYAAMAQFYKLRARGEVGLLLAGGCSPNHAGRPLENGFSIEHDDVVPRHRLITDAVHAEGGRIALQLVHFGREAFHPDLVSSSPQRAANNLFRPTQMTHDDILATICDFGQATRRARDAGYDGIELVGSQGFLLHQFLARHINRRDDQWGGDIDGRLRFAREALRVCRSAAGHDFPIIFRLPALDLMPRCNDADDVLRILTMVREEGADMVNVGIGTHESPVPTISMAVPRAAFAAVANFVKQHAGSLHVVVSNRINDPRLAEELLLEGVADLVAIGRPLLTDPDFVAKAQVNDFAAINTCIACNQVCLDKALFGKAVGCTLNPDCASPTEGELVPAATSRRHAVVGGGIAGMTAAATLARRGHSVDLFERRSRLGGQIRLAGRIPGKEEFLRTIEYYAELLPRLGVGIHLGRTMDEGTLYAQGYDHVLVATGTVPRPLVLPADESVAVLTYEELLEHDLPVAYPVVVIGGGGIALDVALHLASRPSVLDGSERFLRRNLESGDVDRLLSVERLPRKVTILQRSDGKFAPKVGATTRWGLLREMQHLGIDHIKGAVALVAQGKHVHYQRTTGETASVPAATVIVAIGQESDRTLADKLEQAGVPHLVVGGANSADGINITHSVSAAFSAACAL